MNQRMLPDHVTRIEPGETFSFLCHPKVDCFTHCCRHLELALTPYDVLRLRQATGLHSSELLARYLIMEQERGDVFPRFYLTMIDDGNASCVFVTKSGCSVYDNRPGACRTYPLGRAAVRTGTELEEFHVLLREPHCHGFGEDTPQTIDRFTADQHLARYNRFNDQVTEILQHEEIRQGKTLNDAEISKYILALYDIDTFREDLLQNRVIASPEAPPGIDNDDELLLDYAMHWLKNTLFAA